MLEKSSFPTCENIPADPKLETLDPKNLKPPISTLASRAAYQFRILFGLGLRVRGLGLGAFDGF